jgi:hypothetical protein
MAFLGKLISTKDFHARAGFPMGIQNNSFFNFSGVSTGAVC